MYLANTELSSGAYVFFGIVIFLITLGLAYLVFRSIRKESKKYKEEKINYIDGLQQKADLVSDVNTYISRSAAAEFSLIYIDLDKFSNFADAFGKEVSDAIIERVVYILLEILPARIELARLQDDKFIAFAKGEYSREEVTDLAKQIVERIAQPMKVFGESEINITASVGISFYPDHGTKYSVLLNDAEIAVYICKREGGNTYKVYSMENMAESQNLEYYHQIKNGIKNKEFCLYYQPMIDCKTNTVYAVEGLLRWNHPEHGLLSPYKFINIMEQSGDINWVGVWGLESLLQEAEKVLKNNPDKDIKFSFNLSPKQLLNPTLVADYTKVLKRSKVQAKSIILEIEEFAMFEKHPVLKENLEGLNKLGFNIAIDGFNLDYSTLTKLENLPVDIIKVDNDFLDEDEDTYLKGKFVDMLVDYTNKENKTLVTEGIENVDMLKRATSMNLTIMQGYYFAKPMAKEDIEDYIKNGTWKELVEGLNKEENQEEVETNVESNEETINEVNAEVNNQVVEEAEPVQAEEENSEVSEETNSEANEESNVEENTDSTAVEEQAEETVTEEEKESKDDSNKENE